MPFAWTAKYITLYNIPVIYMCTILYRPLFTGDGQVNRLHEMSPLYRQEKERFTDNDLLKLLSDYKK